MISDQDLNKSLFIVQIIASFLVVAGHLSADAYLYNNTLWLDLLNQLSRYGTVLLAIITGYFAALTFEQRNPSCVTYFSGKIKYIVIPYLVAGVLFHVLLRKEFPHTWDAYLNIALGKTGGHLYFVFMIIQYYIFAFLFRKIITKKNILLLIWVFLGIQYIYINYLHHGWFELTARHFFLTWIFTFYMGHLIYWYRERIFSYLAKQPSVLIISTSLALISFVYFLKNLSTYYGAVHISFVIATVISLLVSVILLLDLEKWIRIKFRKGLTFHIYLFHSAIQYGLNLFVIYSFDDIAWIYGNMWYTIAYLIVVYVATLILSLCIVQLIKLLETGFRKKPAQQSVSS